MEKTNRIKEFFFLLRNSPEYLGMLVVTTLFSIGILIGKYIKYGEIF